MKFNAILLSLLGFANLAFVNSASLQSDALIQARADGDAAKCGSLGVMDPNSITDGRVDKTKLRTCAGHPLGRDRSDFWSLAPKNDAKALNMTVEDDLETIDSEAPAEDVAERGVTVANSLLDDPTKRACYYAAPYGCSGGYCWKECGRQPGKWCWTAANYGEGEWRRCGTYKGCGTGRQRFGCGKCASPTCGCSC